MRDMHWCVTVDYQQIENGNIAKQIHGFTIDYGKLILINNRPHYEALVNNYRVCGVYSPEPRAEVYCVRLGRVVRKPVNVNLGLNISYGIVFFLFKNVFHL